MLPSGSWSKRSGLDRARDRLELAGPVLGDSLAADHAASLPGIWPVDLGMHELDRRLDVASVESPVGGTQSVLGTSHSGESSGSSTERAVPRAAHGTEMAHVESEHIDSLVFLGQDHDGSVSQADP